MSRRAGPFASTVFHAELAARAAAAGRKAGAGARGSARERGPRPNLVVVLPDQLSLEIGALRTAEPGETTIVLVESVEWLSRRPYHRQRIAWILFSQRKFALEAADRGFEVEVLSGEAPIVDQLRTRLAQGGRTALVMDPAEREMRAELAPLLGKGVPGERVPGDGLLEVVPHTGFLTTSADLDAGSTSEGWRMDRFYQSVRRRTGILMDHGKPRGGKFSFDAENRRRWDGDPAAPTPPEFPGSMLREEVVAIIESTFAQHPGTLDIATIPGTRAEIDRMWTWAKRSCLPLFGPYEDAMSRRSRGVFHTRISPLLNLHRLLPRTVVEDVAALDIPIASQEGFIRQVLGWREFVYQVHRATDGFRAGGSATEKPAVAPGDGGYARWKGAPWRPAEAPPPGVDGGARPNFLKADLGLPPAYWGTTSGLACLDDVVGDVWAEGWSHHITRLMVLGNIGTLLGVSPRELCDWFWIAYIDAWDWVVEPNVLAMATYATPVMTTKPYVSGSAYLERMGDSCRTCRYTPGKDCPLGPMYWAFLGRNDAILADNLRMKLPLASARGRADTVRAADARAFVALRDVLIRGERQPQAPGADRGSLFEGAPATATESKRSPRAPRPKRPAKKS